MKRIAIAGLHHESNSFNPIVTGEKDFSVLYDAAVLGHLRSNDAITGIVNVFKENDIDIVPTLMARAVPNGDVDQDFYLHLKESILKRLVRAHEVRPLDAICLALHGSMRVVGIGDAEGDLLEAIRAHFKDLPIFSSLDMHATLSQKMYTHCDGFVGFKTAPHVDCTETGAHAARLTLWALKTGKRPKKAWVKIPLLVAGEKSATTDAPMNDLINHLRREEEKAHILAASYLMGYPWSDNPDSGVSVYVLSTDSKALSEQTATLLATTLWAQREAFVSIPAKGSH